MLQQNYVAQADPARPSVWPVFPQSDVPTLLQDPNTRQVFLNPKKEYQKWFWLESDQNPAAVLAANGFADVSFTVPLEEGSLGDFEAVELMSTQTGAFSVLFEDPVLNNRRLMNAPVHHALVFGEKPLPAVLYETIFLMASTSFAVRIVDLSGAGNTVRMVMAGRRFMGCAPRRDVLSAFGSKRTHPYWLTFDAQPFPQVANNTTATFTMTVPSGGDFLAASLMHVCTNGGGVAQDVTVRILEGRSGRSLMNRAISIESFLSGGTYTMGGSQLPGDMIRGSGLPQVLKFTHLFKRSTPIQVEVTNASGAAVDIAMAFHGQMIYYGECMPTAPPTLQQTVMPMPVPTGWSPCGPGGGYRPAPPAPAFLPGTNMPIQQALAMNPTPQQQASFAQQFSQQFYQGIPGGQQQGRPTYDPQQGTSPNPILGPGYGAALPFGL